MKAQHEIPHPSRNAVVDAARRTSGPVVSVYLPVGPIGRDLEYASRRRRATQTARDVLVEHWGFTPAKASDLVAPVVSGRCPFDASSRGGAWFISCDGHTTISLPAPVGPAVEVAETADLLRTLPYLDDGPEFVLLALSQKHAAAFTGNRYRLEPLVVPGMPKNLYDAVWYRTREPQLIRHGSGAMHGTGGAADLHKADVRLYVHQLYKTLEPVVRGSAMPLVVVSVGYEAAILVNEFAVGRAVAVAGNPDHLQRGELRERAWEAVAALDTTGADAAARVSELAGTGMVALDPVEIEAAAGSGTLATLVVSSRLTTGSHDHPDRRLIVRTVAAALAADVTVHVVDQLLMPPGSSLAGILRY